MSQAVTENEEAPIEPIGQVRIVYLGPVEPHWDIQPIWGDEAFVQEFIDRISARLVLLPPHDPQFRRNRERVNRDGIREGLSVEWDLGFPEESGEESPSA